MQKNIRSKKTENIEKLQKTIFELLKKLKYYAIIALKTPRFKEDTL